MCVCVRDVWANRSRIRHGWQVMNSHVHATTTAENKNSFHLHSYIGLCTSHMLTLRVLSPVRPCTGHWQVRTHRVLGQEHQHCGCLSLHVLFVEKAAQNRGLYEAAFYFSIRTWQHNNVCVSCTYIHDIVKIAMLEGTDWLRLSLRACHVCIHVHVCVCVCVCMWYE